NELCDRVAILDRGRLVACETPAALCARLEQAPTFHLVTSTLDAAHANAISGVTGVRRLASEATGRRTYVEVVLHREDAIGAVLATLSALRVDLIELRRRITTL